MKRLPSQFAVSSSLLCQPFPYYKRARRLTRAPEHRSRRDPSRGPSADAPSRGLSPLPPSLESSDVGTVTVGYVP